MKVGFVCSFGMSTYYVLKLVEKAAKAKNLDVKMEAIPVSDLKNKIDGFDLILLGPQLKFKANEVQAVAVEHGKKFANIPGEIYGSMDGDRVLKFILEGK